MVCYSCSAWSCLASSAFSSKDYCCHLLFSSSKPLVTSQCQHWIKTILFRLTSRAFHSLCFVFWHYFSIPKCRCSPCQAVYSSYSPLDVTLFLKVCRKHVSFFHEILLIFISLQITLLPLSLSCLDCLYCLSWIAVCCLYTLFLSPLDCKFIEDRKIKYPWISRTTSTGCNSWTKWIKIDRMYG